MMFNTSAHEEADYNEDGGDSVMVMMVMVVLVLVLVLALEVELVVVVVVVEAVVAGWRRRR